MNIYRNQSSPFFYCTPLYSGTCAGCGAAPSSPSCPGEYPVPYSASQWLVEPSWYKSGDSLRWSYRGGEGVGISPDEATLALTPRGTSSPGIPGSAALLWERGPHPLFQFRPQRNPRGTGRSLRRVFTPRSQPNVPDFAAGHQQPGPHFGDRLPPPLPSALLTPGGKPSPYFDTLPSWNPIMWGSLHPQPFIVYQ